MQKPETRIVRFQVVVHQKELIEVGWMWPAYMSNGAVGDLIKELQGVSPDKRRSLLEAHLPRFYNPPYLASMMAQRYSAVPIVRDFSPQISQAIEAYMLGAFDAAVTTLVPIIEGIIRDIAASRGRDLGSGTSQLTTEIGHLLADSKAFGFDDGATQERIDMIAAFKAFWDDHFIINTKKYAGHGNLNRHGILHAVFGDFGSRANFLILISMLDHLTFAISFRSSPMSVLAPSSNDASAKLLAHYLRLAILGTCRPPIVIDTEAAIPDRYLIK